MTDLAELISAIAALLVAVEPILVLWLQQRRRDRAKGAANLGRDARKASAKVARSRRPMAIRAIKRRSGQND